MTAGSVSVHLAIAETGKQAALRGDHRTALAHYRDAMRLAVGSGAPEVFFRYYLEATMESLELMGELGSVLDYCDRAVEHYRQHPPAHAIAWYDLASVHQRRAMVLLKLGDIASARSALGVALASAEQAPATLPLAEKLHEWLRRGLSISPERVIAEQHRFRYFSNRAETVGQYSAPPQC